MYKHKRVIGIVTTIIASTAYSFAVESYDCKLVGLISEWAASPTQLDKKFGYLLDKDSLTMALQNLRAYCSSAKLIDEKIGKNADSANNFPESPYLYDHLIDVATRKRDWWQSNAYNLEVDAKTVEYRKYMDEVATLPQGKSPDDIIKKIKELWIPKTNTYIESYSPAVCDKTAQRNDLTNKTLYEKLSNICTISRCAYDAMVKNIPNKDSTIATAIGYEKCQNMISEKIYAEFTYMNSVINEAANRKLQKNINEYLTNYFARDRLINLQNKIGETYDAFAVVNRFVQEWTKQCSG